MGHGGRWTWVAAHQSELLSDIETLYHPKPFHNFAHACTVTHVVFITLFHIPNLSQYFFLQDLTALLLAGAR